MSGETVAVLPPPEVWEETDGDVDGLLDDWHVAEGDPVTAGQHIASVMVVKTSFEVSAPAGGRVGEILVPKGETFGREDALALIVPGGHE